MVLRNIAFSFLFVFSGYADAATFLVSLYPYTSSIDGNWYRSDGSNNLSGNLLTGFYQPPTSNSAFEHRTYLVFDTSSIPTSDVTSIRFVIGSAEASGGNGTLTLFSVETSISDLTNQTRTCNQFLPCSDIFEDLGSGTIYGTALSDIGSGQPIVVDFTPEGQSDLIDTKSQGMFAFGMAFSGNGYLFGGFSSRPRPLFIEITTVPIPPALWSVASALFLLVLRVVKGQKCWSMSYEK